MKTQSWYSRFARAARAPKGAHNALLDLEELEDQSLQEFRRRYQQLAHQARAGIGPGNLDTDSPQA